MRRSLRPIAQGLALVILFWGALEGKASAATAASELLYFKAPPHFKLAYQSPSSAQNTMEFIPENDSLEHWSIMVLVQEFRGIHLSAPDFLQNAASQQLQNCPDSKSGALLNSYINGYSAAFVLLTCPKNPETDLPETSLIRVVRGEAALYSVQFLFRLDPSQELIAKAAHFLEDVTVCNQNPYVRHPCPKTEDAVPVFSFQ